MNCGRATSGIPSGALAGALAAEPLSELLVRSGRGDQQAFARLHAATRNKMRKTAAGVSPFTADLDDLVQDAYLKVWRYAADFDPNRASPITWMCAIMRHTDQAAQDGRAG